MDPRDLILNRGLIDELCGYLRTGLHPESCADLCGIPRETLTKATEIALGSAYGTPEWDFLSACRKAQARFECDSLKTIALEVKSHKGLEYVLNQLNPDRYERKNKPTSGAVTVSLEGKDIDALMAHYYGGTNVRKP